MGNRRRRKVGEFEGGREGKRGGRARRTDNNTTYLLPGSDEILQGRDEGAQVIRHVQRLLDGGRDLVAHPKERGVEIEEDEHA